MELQNSNDKTSHNSQSKDIEEKGIFAIALQETRWEEVIIKRRIGNYIWFGGGAIRNRAK